MTVDYSWLRHPGICLCIGHAIAFAIPDIWQPQQSGVDASLRGISVVDENTVWASGTGGTVLRSVDGGQHWLDVRITEASQLDFRDIHAFNADRAVVLSAGQPARIYQTSDGGQSWQLVFQHPDKRAFFNALSFFDKRHAIAMSDPVSGRLLLLESRDGGRHWQQLPSDRRPVTNDGEAGFAASGTNMRVVGDSVFIALGGAARGKQEPSSRVVYSVDRGHSWQSAEVPVVRSESRGIFSLAFADNGKAIAVGGDFQKPAERAGNIAVSDDGGKSWIAGNGQTPRGYRSAVALNQGGKQPLAICVGPNGTDISFDYGRNWQAASDQGFHTVAFSPDGKHAWAAGSNGRIAKWSEETGK